MGNLTYAPPLFYSKTSKVLTDLVQKYGRPNEATPAKWNQEYIDYHAPPGETLPLRVNDEEVKTEDLAIVPATSNGEPAEVETEKKDKKDKKRKHEGETAEERA